jgi:hypothetical protein
MSREPLQSSHYVAILCNNIIGHPTLRSSFEGGNPSKSKNTICCYQHLFQSWQHLH